MRPLLLAIVVSTAACSSADFDVASADPDTGSPSQVEDSFVPPPDSTEPAPSDARPAEAMPADACSNLPPTPPCTLASNGYDYQIDTARSYGVGQLYKGRELAIHTKMPRAGRIRKLILRMNAVPSGISAGVEGQVKITAYLRGCMPLPIGQTALPVQTGEDWAFYFDPTQVSGSTVLADLPAGTDIDFVVTTDSTAYKFNMVGAAAPTTNPYGLYWGQREGSAGGWAWHSATMLSIAVWTYTC